MRTYLALFWAKFVTFIVIFFGLGHASTWPGEIALYFDKQFLFHIVKKNPDLKIILIAGTNGKTTTAKLITHVLSELKFKVFSNNYGANLLNGLSSSFISRSNLTGRIPDQIAVLEVDENTLSEAIKQLRPQAIVLLNLFRDQLDRYGEINVISQNWREALSRLNQPITLILNAQDAQIASLTSQKNIKTYFFGLSSQYLNKKTTSFEADSIYCPRCLHKLTFQNVAYSHIGNFECPECHFRTPTFSDLADGLNLPIDGLYNRYNYNAAAELLRSVFNLNKSQVHKHLINYNPAFGRQEIIHALGHSFWLQLSKNPVGFNQAIELLPEQSNVLLILNDNLPDGKDVSWIWDVDYEALIKKTKYITVSGQRAKDLGIRIRYAHSSIIPLDIDLRQNLITIGSQLVIIDNLTDAIHHVASVTKTDEMIYVLPVYSAMLEVRQILTGDNLE